VGAPLLELREISSPSAAGTTGLDGLDLSVWAGEVLGVAGVDGNGQRELVEVASGLRRPSSGRVLLNGAPAPVGARSSFVDRGVSLVPEDRQAEGLLLELELADNLVLDKVHERPYSGRLGLRRRVIRDTAERLIRRFSIRARGPDAPARTLSGGNQQKAVLARALRDAPRLIVAHQPTRGLDVAAAVEVLDRLASAARSGAAVLLVSSTLEEILSVADRIVVLYRGRAVGELQGEDASRDELGRLMVGAQGAT
jgi:simple sugar transport system ATP-binding protein